MKASPMSLFEEFIKEAYGSQYVIPVYQRNYTWKKNKQVSQLLEDIKKILDGKIERHFIGTIVYVIVKTDFMVRERAVVDGQQRLITMFLIAHALREIANNHGEKTIASALTTDYLENMSKEDNYKYRLRTSISDDTVYEYIAKEKFSEAPESKSNIYYSYEYIRKEVESLVNQYGLMKVINAIRELYIVRIELEDTDNAQQIFESINSTGEKLTAADLIRNYILMNKPNDRQEEIYNNYWLKIEKSFEDSKKLEEFFRFYLAVKNYVLVPIKELYEQFKIHWQSELSKTDENAVLQDILTYALHFKRLYYSNSDDVLGEAIKDYRRLQTLMPAPFMVHILELNRVNPDTVTNETTAKIMKLVITYLIRRYITGQDTSSITRFFPTYLKNVLNTAEKEGMDNLLEICKYWLINDTRLKSMFMPDDNQVKRYLEMVNAYSLQHTKWLLEKIENMGNPAPVDLSKLNIEHIMPQTSNDYWDKVSGLNKEDYEVYVNKLGNLTLVASVDNSAMGNKDFATKKKVLENTNHLNLNKEIWTSTEWNTEDIDKRTETLIGNILLLFPYEKSAYNYGAEENDRRIFIHRADINASGFLHKDDKVTIYADSMIRYNVAPISQTLKELRDELLDSEIVIHDNGIYKFSQDYVFNSPSSAADFIIGGSNNGWDLFKDINGMKINMILRRKE